LRRLIVLVLATASCRAGIKLAGRRGSFFEVSVSARKTGREHDWL
jgi:hypothetical protein